MNISPFLKKLGITTSVGMVCGIIGCIEGAISGATGAAILGQTVKTAANMGAVGVGFLGIIEGLILGMLAVNGIFGSYEDMKQRGFKNWKNRILGYLGYTGNQIVGGLIAGLFSICFGQMVLNVALGAAITRIIITPIVTMGAALILASAYSAARV